MKNTIITLSKERLQHIEDHLNWLRSKISLEGYVFLPCSFAYDVFQDLIQYGLDHDVYMYYEWLIQIHMYSKNTRANQNNIEKAIEVLNTIKNKMWSRFEEQQTNSK